MLNILRKKKVFIIVITILLTVILSGYDFLSSYYKITMTLTLNYEGVEKGLNPDGSRFNIFEIVSSDVLDRTLNKVDAKEMTVDQLKDRIDVFSLGTSNSVSKVKDAILAGETYFYTANTYTISYAQKNRFTYNRTRQIAVALSEAYKEYFMERYTDKGAVLSINKEELEQGEYLMSAEMLSQDIDKMIKYLEKSAKENGTYSSPSSGQNFESLVNMLNNLKSTEVEKYKSFIIESAVAKNSKKLISQLEYKNKLLTTQYNKSAEEHKIMLETIDKYDPNVTRVVFIPSEDSNRDFYMSRTKTGIDYLTTKASTAASLAESSLKAIKYNEYVMGVYSNATHTPEENEKLSNDANTMLTYIENSLYNILDLANITDKEYREYKSKDYLTFKIPRVGIMSTISLKNLIWKFLISLVLAVILAVFLAKRKDFYSKTKNITNTMFGKQLDEIRQLKSLSVAEKAKKKAQAKELKQIELEAKHSEKKKKKERKQSKKKKKGVTDNKVDELVNDADKIEFTYDEDDNSKN